MDRIYGNDGAYRANVHHNRADRSHRRSGSTGTTRYTGSNRCDWPYWVDRTRWAGICGYYYCPYSSLIE